MNLRKSTRWHLEVGREVSGFLQLFERLGILQKRWLIAAALGITLVLWFSLNWMWPDFPLDYSESFALFLIVLLVLFLFSKMLDVISRWSSRGR
jgi:hypothetical protein